MNRSAQHAFEPEEVMAYLDGELELRRAGTLAAHLEHCDECQALAAQLRQLSERLLDFHVEPSSARMDEAVSGALEFSEPRTRTVSSDSNHKERLVWRRLFARPYAWALACILAVITIVAVSVPNLLKSRGGPHVASERRSGLVELDESRVAPYLAATRKNQRVTPGDGGSAINAPAPTGPMIAQTVSLTIIAANYDEASAVIDRLAGSQGGYVQKLTGVARSGAARELSVTLRVPAKQLDGFLAELRKLGHVERESRANDEVTDQYVDLQARLRSARASEQRLLELLATRTGKLEDVLDAERELGRVRGEIESMEGQRVLLLHRVQYATVEVQLSEVYRERLNAPSSSTITSIRNAAIEGFGNFEDGVIGILLFLLAYGPSILLWLGVFLVPAWFVWRRFRKRSSSRT